MLAICLTLIGVVAIALPACFYLGYLVGREATRPLILNDPEPVANAERPLTIIARNGDQELAVEAALESRATEGLEYQWQNQ